MAEAAVTEKPKDAPNRMAELFLRKKELEAELKDVNEQLESLSESLVNSFTDQGLQRLNLACGVTLRLDCKIWPKVKSTPEAVAAIKAAGLTDLLARESYQAMSLAKFLREADENGDELPEAFKGVIEPNPVYKIIPTRS